jgi:hypothetical protein
MFEFPYIISLYYIKNQQDAILAVLFIVYYLFYLFCNRVWTSLLAIYHPDPCHAPVAATTVFSTPDDGRRKRPKHVE